MININIPILISVAILPLFLVHKPIGENMLKPRDLAIKKFRPISETKLELSMNVGEQGYLALEIESKASPVAS